MSAMLLSLGNLSIDTILLFVNAILKLELLIAKSFVYEHLDIIQVACDCDSLLVSLSCRYYIVLIHTVR